MEGLLVPLITPFTATGEVDLPTLRDLAAGALDAGAAGLVALGTTGEPSSLTPAEQHDVVTTIAHVAGTRPLICGVDHPAATVRLIAPPPFVTPGERATVAYYAALPKPVIAYHVPHRTGQPLSTRALLDIAALPGVVGVKYAAKAIDADTIAFMAGAPGDCVVLAGDDPTVYPLLALGARGAICASANVDTAAYARLVADPDRDRARRLAALSAALFAEPNPTVIKAVLHAQGRIKSAYVRPPLLPPSPRTTESALAALDHEDRRPASGITGSAGS